MHFLRLRWQWDGEEVEIVFNSIIKPCSIPSPATSHVSNIAKPRKSSFFHIVANDDFFSAFGLGAKHMIRIPREFGWGGHSSISVSSMLFPSSSSQSSHSPSSNTLNPPALQ